MFPLTHLYFAEKLWRLMPELPYDSSLLALGSTFPDVVVAGFLAHNQTHRGAVRMVDYFKTNAPEFLPFALGVLSHGSEPRGLDYYGDEKYQTFERGYCFEKARPIVADVVRYCHWPEKDGWWKAHNFIEMAIEVDLGEQYPELQRRVYAAYHDKDMIRSISEVLMGYFKIPIDNIFNSFEYFAKFMTMEATTATDLAKRYCLQLQSNQELDVDTNGIEATIHNSRELVKTDFQDFEQYVDEKLYELFLENAMF